MSYEDHRVTFDWDAAGRALDGLPDGRGLNIAHEAVDRHAQGPLAQHVALRCLRKRGGPTDVTYAELGALTSRFAHVLDELGVGAGDLVLSLSGRVPELYVTALGTLKHRSVFSPLFSAFGPDPIAQRIELGHGRVLVTTTRLYQRKVATIRERLPTLEHVLLIDGGDTPPDGTLDLHALLDAASDRYEIQPTDPEDLALLHFTSGTTGMPKGAMHVHGAVLAHHVTGGFALDLRPDDVFWCTADPGWVTGTSYGIISPLSHGLTCIVDEAEFDAEHWYRTLQDERVNVWYTAPTALRMLMRAGDALPHEFDLGALRFVASVGEALNPEVVLWGRDVLGHAIHDNWWQTETGGIMIANVAGDELRPGSMGRPLPGIDAALLERDADGEAALDPSGGPVLVDTPDTPGELVLRTGWPSMFRGYLGQDERYRRCFVGDWYRTGDLARRDADGWYWFIGRADDVIKSSGHLIGPFEVESALLEHPAVAEAGVIGVPDEMAGEIVEASVTLNVGFEPTEELELELLGFARSKLGAAVAPKAIHFDQDLPRTRSGKIMRRLLRSRRLGLPEGDLSTLEPPTP
jgi:acetyl-CoA synthetase